VRRSRNRAIRTQFRNTIKQVLNSEENPEDLLKKAQSQLDRAATKGIIHKKTASRRAGRLAKRIHAASSE
ncbi:MAG: 30S ribosomal protein S20, partial [Nitrospinae bacterium]|nr:30S ribosomal protein S20 [Nitrospinota bacterium]